MRCSVLGMMLTVICAAVSVSSANDLKVNMTTLTGFSTMPGDTLRYVIKYDNDYIHSDTTSPSTDTAYITSYLPGGTVFLDTFFNRPDTNVARGPGGAWADGFRVEYLYQASWLDHIPDGRTTLSRDSLIRISAVRYVIPPGIGEDSTGTNVDNNSSDHLTADDSLDNDAGYMSYMVRIAHTPAGQKLVNGTFDGLAADAFGELSLAQGDSLAGIPGDSIRFTDSVSVEPVYGFSSLDSLDVPDVTGAANYDTVYAMYCFQNYGNGVSDSFHILVTVADTADNGHFTLTDFDICLDTAGFDAVTGGFSKDSLTRAIRLSALSIDTFYVRAVIPSGDSAAPGENISVVVQIKGNNGTGAGDNWPGFPDGLEGERIVIDTAGIIIHASADTLLDYGDTQRDTFLITVADPGPGGPVVRAGLSYTATGNLPGDTVIYSIRYDNDGAQETSDSLVITNILPRGITFLDTFMNTMDTGPGHAGPDRISVRYRCGSSAWLEHRPSTPESLLLVTALRFVIPPGTGVNNSGTDTGDDSLSLAADGTFPDTDAGEMIFWTRIGCGTVPGYAVASAGSVIVNGWWDETNAVANSPGEMTMATSGIFSGIPVDSIKPSDSLQIGSAHAFSSLDSLRVPIDTGRLQPMDTAYFEYIVQNQGNTADSFYIVASVKDTANAVYFSPASFCFVTDTAGADNIVGLEFDTSRTDSAWYAFRLAQEAVNTFYLRIILPGPTQAAAGDSLVFEITVSGNSGSGTDDAWPGLTVMDYPARTVLDTFTAARLYHTHGDTLWDYGDRQTVRCFLTVGAKPPTVINAPGTYDFDTTGVVMEVLGVSGTDTVTVQVTRDEYPPDMHQLRNPVPRFYDISVGPGIDSITAVVTLAYTAEEFAASGLTDETGLYAVRYDSGRWESLASVVDTAANTVSCTTSAFSLWAIDGVCRSVGCPSCTVSYVSQPITAAYAGLPYICPLPVAGGMIKQLVNAPEGMTIAGDTLYWLPDLADTGIHQVTVWGNGICLGDSHAFIITVFDEPETTRILTDAASGKELSVYRVATAAGRGEIFITLPGTGSAQVSLQRVDGTTLAAEHVRDVRKGCRLQIPGTISSGAYLIRIRKADRTLVRKIMLLQ